MIRILLTRQSLLLLLVFSAAAVWACHIPLIDTLGYESSVLIAVLCAVAGGWHSLRFNRISCNAGSTGGIGDFLRLSLATVFAQWTLLLAPILVLAGNAARIPNCSLGPGFIFFLLIPFMTVLFTSCLTLLLRCLFKSWGAHAAYCLIILMLFFHPVLQVFSNPQLYAYNHLFGMFVGFSWDEAQPPIATLLLYRSTTAAYALLFLTISYTLRNKPLSICGRKHVIAVFIPVSLFIGTAYLYSDDLGFSNSAVHASAELGSAHHTDNFIIYYDGSSMTREEIEDVGFEHEFRLRQIARELEVKWHGVVVSWIYPDAATKRRLLGTETSHIARPWMREIHLSEPSWRIALKHELAHVVAGDFGPFPFKAPVFRNFGLTEGLAMALEGEYNGSNLHGLAEGMRRAGIIPPVRDFLTTKGFLRGAASSGYVASGSFCRWLMDSAGVSLLKTAYKNDDPEYAAGIGLTELETRWHAFLSQTQKDAPAPEAIRYLFERQSIFGKICPRVLTEINREASVAMEGGDYPSALVLYRKSESLVPNTSAIFGQARALARLGQYDRLQRLCETALGDSTRRASLLPLRLWYGDAAWFNADTATASYCYRLIAASGLGGRIGAEAEMRLLSMRNPRAGHLLMNIVALGAAYPSFDSLAAAKGPELGRAFRLDSSDNLVRYLYARGIGKGNPAQAIGVLSNARKGAYYEECMSAAGDLLYKRNELERARDMYRNAGKSASGELRRRRANEGVERCEWKMKKPGKGAAEGSSNLRGA